MARLSTSLLLKFLRSIRNETHHENPAGFWGGLFNVYKLRNKEFLFENKKHLLKNEFTPAEKILIKLIELRLYFAVYFYYALICGRMRKFQEKTKN